MKSSMLLAMKATIQKMNLAKFEEGWKKIRWGREINNLFPAPSYIVE